MKRSHLNLTEEEWALLEELELILEEEINTADIPELLDVRNPRRGSDICQEAVGSKERPG